MFKLFQKKDKENFSSQMIELIESVINGRLSIHHKYEILIKKLSKSNKSINTKLAISRYIMHRILRESDRVFIKAQIEANRLCPCEHNQNKNGNNENNQTVTYHWTLESFEFLPKKSFAFRIYPYKKKFKLLDKKLKSRNIF